MPGVTFMTFQPIYKQCFQHIETRKLICGSNRRVGFYMMKKLFEKQINLFKVTVTGLESTIT